jgi:hypothetical protein
MSSQGVKELWNGLPDAGPGIMGVVIEVDEDYELPPMYRASAWENDSATSEDG